MIKSNCSKNKFKISNLKNFAYIYLKIRFNITILLHMLFLSIKCMHFIDNAVYALLNTMHIASYWVRRYNGLCKYFNNCVWSLPGNTAIKSRNRLLFLRFQCYLNNLCFSFKKGKYNTFKFYVNKLNFLPTSFPVGLTDFPPLRSGAANLEKK